MNHKIKINNIEVELTEEQIRELHSRLENKGEKYFFPKKGDTYYVLNTTEISSNLNEEDFFDAEAIARGCFRTKEIAEKEDEKRLALVRMWKWVQENGLYWTPDWTNEEQSKVAPFYNHKQKKWLAGYCSNSQYGFDLPNFKSESDCQKFIDNNLSDLNLFV